MDDGGINIKSEEAALVARILAGERDLFGELISRYENMVYAMIFRQIQDREMARELTQETFFRGYRYLNSFRHESSFSTWISRIALNSTASYFKSKAYRTQKTSTEFVESEHGGLNNIVDRERTKGKQISDQVAALSEKYRAVVVLCFFEGRTYQEVAAILQVPVGTICSRMNQALKMLRTSFVAVEDEK